MTLFRLILAAIIAVVIAYTVPVIESDGIDFFTPFFADIAAMNWAGQFNVDFSAMLILASMWVMWRNEFSPLGILFGLLVFVGGAPFLSTYLLILSFRAKGDMKEVLLGKRRASV
jgi:hypothetical protein